MLQDQQANSQPLASVVTLVLPSCPAPLILIGYLRWSLNWFGMLNWWKTKSVREMTLYWLFSLAKQCTRRETTVQRSHRRLFSFFIFIISEYWNTCPDEAWFRRGQLCDGLQLFLASQIIVAFPVSPFEWRIPTAAPCWYNELFRFMQAPNVCGQLVAFVMCSSATFFGPDTDDASQLHSWPSMLSVVWC